MGSKSSKKKNVNELEQPPPPAKRSDEYKVENTTEPTDVYEKKSSSGKAVVDVSTYTSRKSQNMADNDDAYFRINICLDFFLVLRKTDAVISRITRVSVCLRFA